MKLTKCDAGHFYDGDKYPECPYCNTALQQDGGSGIVVAAQTEAARTPDGALPLAAGPTAVFGSLESYARLAADAMGPVTGWLVVLNGPAAGRDFRLCEGRALFGLTPEGEPCALSPDAPLSARLLTVVYDAAAGEFSVLPGSGQALAYLDGKAVLAPQPLKNGDELGLGEAKLRFVAFCGAFRWPKNVKNRPARRDDGQKTPGKTEKTPDKPAADKPAQAEKK